MGDVAIVSTSNYVVYVAAAIDGVAKFLWS